MKKSTIKKRIRASQLVILTFYMLKAKFLLIIEKTGVIMYHSKARCGKERSVSGDTPARDL